MEKRALFFINFLTRKILNNGNNDDKPIKDKNKEKEVTDTDKYKKLAETKKVAETKKFPITIDDFFESNSSDEDDKRYYFKWYESDYPLHKNKSKYDINWIRNIQNNLFHKGYEQKYLYNNSIDLS